MMMLQELLRQEQEPFLLNTCTYINKKQKQKQIYENDSSSNNNTIFLHVPATTATLLLQAARRIQNHPSKSANNKGTTGFRVLGSFFNRLINKKKQRRQLLTEDPKQSRSNNVNKKVKMKGMATWSSSCASFDRTTTFSSSSSSGICTPEFSSPSCHRIVEDKENNDGADSINKFQSRDQEEEEDEEKEQCSPVSVLDPPFDDDDVHGNDYEDDDGFDLECSYANLQRTNQKLLHRLRRFEELAELDPLELEKRMLDQEDGEYGTITDEEGGCEKKDSREIVYGGIIGDSSIRGGRRVPEDLKRLISDLVMEEENRGLGCLEDREMVVKRVCRRLELWEEVDSNTIDMMVDEDFSREQGLWKQNGMGVRDLAAELELAIFGFLVEEFSEELELVLIN